MSERLSATPDSDAFRATAFRIAQGVRAAEEMIAARSRGGRLTASDRPAWADLNEAADRLVALIAQYEPPDLDIEAGPPGGAPPPPISRHRRGIVASEVISP